MYSNIGYATTATTLLIILIKILFVLFVVGLIVGLILSIKNYVFTAEDATRLKSTSYKQKPIIIKEACASCGKDLNNDWNICPYCGKAKDQNTVKGDGVYV